MVHGAGGSRDPGRAIQLPSGWYVPECGNGMAWFRDGSGGALSNLTLVGDVIERGTDGISEFECPDVFELGGKTVSV